MTQPILKMYHPELAATAETTREAFDTVWSDREWVLLEDALPEVMTKVLNDPDGSSDAELRMALNGAGGGFAPLDNASRSDLIATAKVLQQHADSPSSPEVAARIEEAKGATYNPAEHTVDEVNKYLATANEDERVRVLELEDQGRPGVPDTKQQRSGILGYPNNNRIGD